MHFPLEFPHFNSTCGVMAKSVTITSWWMWAANQEPRMIIFNQSNWLHTFIKKLSSRSLPLRHKLNWNGGYRVPLGRAFAQLWCIVSLCVSMLPSCCDMFYTFNVYERFCPPYYRKKVDPASTYNCNKGNLSCTDTLWICKFIFYVSI